MNLRTFLSEGLSKEIMLIEPQLMYNETGDRFIAIISKSGKKVNVKYITGQKTIQDMADQAKDLVDKNNINTVIVNVGYYGISYTMFAKTLADVDVKIIPLKGYSKNVDYTAQEYMDIVNDKVNFSGSGLEKTWKTFLGYMAIELSKQYIG
jgi:hypothetical protein